MGQSQMWVSDRLRGIQPIGLDDMQRFARALDVEVYDLLPSRAVAETAAQPRDTERYLPVTVPVQRDMSRPLDNRPTGRPHTAAGSGATRTAYADRPHRRRKDR